MATGRIGIRPFLGHHRDTVARALREPLDKQAAPRQRVSAVAVSPRLSNPGLTNNGPFRHVVDGRANRGGGSNSRRLCFYHTGLKKHLMAYITLETES